MIRVFLDTCVLFAAVLSSSGGCRALIDLAIEGEVEIILRSYVVQELRNTLLRKVPDVRDDLEHLLQLVPYEVVDPSRAEVLAASKYKQTKDAPIAAAAVKAGVDHLVTLDRRRLLEPPAVAEGSGFANRDSSQYGGSAGPSYPHIPVRGEL